MDEMMSNIPDLQGHGLDNELGEALTAGYEAVRECTRLFASIPFLTADATTYRELAGRVHAAVERASVAHLSVDVRLRRGGATGALLALVNDARTVRANVPLDPPTDPAEYVACLQTLEVLQQSGTGHGTLFQQHEGRGIMEAVVHELALIPARPVITLPPEQIEAIAAAFHRSAPGPQPRGHAASRGKPGNRTLEEKGELKKLNIYRQIDALYDREEGLRVGRRERFLLRLQNAGEHRDLREQIAAAGLTLDHQFIKNAISCIAGQKQAKEVAKAD